MIKRTMDYLKEKKDSFRRKQLRVFLNNLCVDNESTLCLSSGAAAADLAVTTKFYPEI